MFHDFEKQRKTPIFREIVHLYLAAERKKWSKQMANCFCPVTGNQILSGGFQLDHVYPNTFSSIRASFIINTGSTIEVLKDIGRSKFLARFGRDFFEYHKNYAVLYPISKFGNMYILREYLKTLETPSLIEPNLIDIHGFYYSANLFYKTIPKNKLTELKERMLREISTRYMANSRG